MSTENRMIHYKHSTVTSLSQLQEPSTSRDKICAICNDNGDVSKVYQKGYTTLITQLEYLNYEAALIRVKMDWDAGKLHAHKACRITLKDQYNAAVIQRGIKIFVIA